MQLNKSDISWGNLDGEPILVKEFIPLAILKDEKVRSRDLRTPYARVSIISPKLTGQEERTIVHRLDFLHLWEAFKIRGIAESEEVLIHWSRHHHKGLLKLFSYFLPRIHLMICQEGTYIKMSNSNWWKGGGGEQPALSIQPLQEWKPLSSRRGA